MTMTSMDGPGTIQFSNGGSPVTLQTTTYPSPNDTDVATLQSHGATLQSSTIVDSYGRTQIQRYAVYCIKKNFAIREKMRLLNVVGGPMETATQSQELVVWTEPQAL